MAEMAELEQRNRELSDLHRLQSEYGQNVTHELRSPLNGILGLTSVLLAEPLEPAPRANVERIGGRARALLAVINSILDLSRLEAGRLIHERFNRINQLAEQEPDLIVLDVNMPFVPGDELHALLKQHPLLRRVPVVFSSSNDERELRQLARSRLSRLHSQVRPRAFVDRVARFLPTPAEA